LLHFEKKMGDICNQKHKRVMRLINGVSRDPVGVSMSARNLVVIYPFIEMI